MTCCQTWLIFTKKSDLTTRLSSKPGWLPVYYLPGYLLATRCKLTRKGFLKIYQSVHRGRQVGIQFNAIFTGQPCVEPPFCELVLFKFLSVCLLASLCDLLPLHPWVNEWGTFQCVFTFLFLKGEKSLGFCWFCGFCILAQLTIGWFQELFFFFFFFFFFFCLFLWPPTFFSEKDSLKGPKQTQMLEIKLGKRF